ncbi:hypothetical protein C4K68_17260 [Pokkaliibacter plantistimulans]|uniref:Uncharacterized protein n=1 Tax=Proteobacteria bacterium 228 TaxID=2083153 RepID=A0A2S5KPB6_9PROT|nr:hypothetical protein [Pokkaliibacter plantistimulans]PPC76136.1 hypothetical protein C4K68_17260 [Pokkaliibacter plantistimulans]
MDDKQVDIELLEKEYFHLQSEIENFDEKSLTIKAWGVSLAGAIAGSSAFTDSKIVILFAALVSLMFWFIDAAWKTFQYANYRRVGHIEEYMRGERENIENLQIASSWSISYHNGGNKRLFKIMFWPHVALPHGAMFVLLSVIYIFSSHA